MILNYVTSKRPAWTGAFTLSFRSLPSNWGHIVRRTSVKQPKSLRFIASQTALAGIAGAGVAGAAPAAAEEAILLASAAPSVRDEIIVEGEKHGSNPYADPAAPYKIDRSASSKLTEDLLNTAKSVSVISKELIDDAGATSFRDIVRTQPGVTIGTGEGGNAFGDRIFIRGFDARNDVYVDGVRDPGVVSREVFAVAQIEILKGPSGSFAGRGSTGGQRHLPPHRRFQLCVQRYARASGQRHVSRIRYAGPR